MASTGVKIEITTEFGNVAELQRAISLRQQHLSETTAQSIFAVSNTALGSLKAATLKANPESKKEVTVEKAPEYRTGFHHGARCAYRGREYVKAVNTIGAYVRGEGLNVGAVFRVHETFYGEYLVLARDIGSARSYAWNRHRKRVAKAAGLAKYVFSCAQQILACGTVSPMSVPARAQKVGRTATYLNKNSTGFARGVASVEFQDLLKYAPSALPGGSAYVATAIKKAANSAVGQINTKLKLPLKQKYTTPFPEVKG